MGCKVIHYETSKKNLEGEIIIHDNSHRNNPWYDKCIEEGVCKRISIVENLYGPSDDSCPVWFPSGSALPAICALTYFAKKVNVYGWDFYLESSPEDMTSWQLFSNLYKYKLDVSRSRTHFESAMINFYYGYQLSLLPNIQIHGYLGKLQKHEKLIGKIESVLLNT